MYFPECAVNGKSLKDYYWAAGRGQEIAGRGFAGGGVPIQGVHSARSRHSAERFGPEEVRKLIEKKDRKTLQKLVLQYLVLNPEAFKPGGVLPLLIMGPGFKQGQFTPGFLLVGANTGVIEAPNGIPRPPISNEEYEGKYRYGLSGLVDEAIDFFSGDRFE